MAQGFLAEGLASNVALGLLSENPSGGLQSTPRAKSSLGTALGHRFTWLPIQLVHRLSHVVLKRLPVGMTSYSAILSLKKMTPLACTQNSCKK